MTTLKDLRDKAIEMTGSDEYADEMLGSIISGGNDEYTAKEMRLKYESMCVDEISEGQCVTVTRLSDGIYRIKDELDQDEYVCIIKPNGELTFYQKTTSYKNLAEYVKECSE